MRDEAAPEATKNLRMAGGFERIITHQFQSLEEHEEYQELRGILRFQVKASSLSYGALLDALDKAQDDAHRAAELAARARIAWAEFEMDAKIIEGALRKEAIEHLEERKAELAERTKGKTSGKQITNDDAIAYIASNAPDEWASLESKRVKAKESVDLLKDLAERHAERAKDLRAMVSKTRAVE